MYLSVSQVAFETTFRLGATFSGLSQNAGFTRLRIRPVRPRGRRWSTGNRLPSVIPAAFNIPPSMTRSPLSSPAQPSPSTAATNADRLSSHAQMLLQLLTRLVTLDAQLKRIKCPFWRRRFSDAVTTLSQIVRWAIQTRHKSLTLPPFLLSPSEKSSSKEGRKLKHLDMCERVNIIRDDFVKRQYYVTGRLSTQMYRDDCLFDGPDPDGRVRGTRKFVDAAAGLFDARMSKVDLIDIYEDRVQSHGGCDKLCIVAHWRLEGALKLPWRPRIKPYVGCTTYTFDTDGLIAEHFETWQISVVEAFLSVVFDRFGSPPAPPITVLRQRRRDGGLQRWDWKTDDKILFKIGEDFEN